MKEASEDCIARFFSVYTRMYIIHVIEPENILFDALISTDI